MIEHISLKKLKFLERNPRTITKAQMQKCVDSLRTYPEFLSARPVLVNLRDDKYIVYAGHQRVKAAKKLKWETIECYVSHDMSDEEMKHRVILDNAHYGDNDFDILANEYDVELLLECGFTEKELQLDADESAIEILSEDSEDQNETEDKIKYCPHCSGIL